MNKLEGIKLEGYENTWYEIDRLETKDATYVLFENEVYGDETCGVVVRYTEARNLDGEIPDRFIVCETFDDIKTALEDEGLL